VLLTLLKGGEGEFELVYRGAEASGVEIGQGLGEFKQLVQMPVGTGVRRGSEEAIKREDEAFGAQGVVLFR